MRARPHVWHGLALALLLSFGAARHAEAAHLPAVRREPDSKRVLASRLIRSADRHKESSLRDVLGESHGYGPAFKRGRDQERRKRRAEETARETVLEREGRIRKGEEEEEEEEQEDEEEDEHGIRTMSELFQWAINNTVRGANYSKGFKVAERKVVGVEAGSGAKAVEVGATFDYKLNEAAKMDARTGKGMGASRRKALPAGKPRLQRETVRKARRKRDAPAGKPTSPSVEDDMEILSSASESEYDIIRRNVHVVDAAGMSASKKVRALLMLEELCHSIDNGRDLQVSGGIKPLLRALQSRHDKVRASAAWALATCCQNNPPVQNASLALDAVPILSNLAAHDASSGVRSRALFALNAMLELESARAAFEELPYAIDAVRNALVDTSDFRATRRALNLTELLVQKNLDSWKTQLEAWDIPILVERLMRSHPDIDVRESAARTIAALDGRPVA